MTNPLVILQQVNTFMESIDDLYRLLQQIMKVSMEAVSAQASTVFLYDPDQGVLSFDVALGEKGDQLNQCRVKPGQGIAGCCALNLEVLNITDVREDARFDTSWDDKTGFTTNSVLAVPMVRRGELVGVLEVINKEGAPGFDAQDQELICLIASQAAIAVENAKLYQTVLDKNHHLQKALIQLKDTQKKLIQAEKMSTIGNMSGQIMHDIRNPMTIICLSCDILGNPEITNKNIPELIRIIKAQVDRSVNMIRDFLDFARGETHLDLRPQNVDNLVNEIVSTQQHDCADKGISFKVNIECTGQITVDEDKIHRVLTNLINNAKEAVIESSERPGSILLHILPCNGCIEFRITDNGPGIPKDIQTKLFEPFVTLGKKEGTGLGLAIVDKLVRDHGGSISVDTCRSGDSEKRESGTTFTVAIPAIPVSTPA